MRPSECIRAGAQLIKESQMVYLSLLPGPMPPCGCALGAGLVGVVGVRPAQLILKEIEGGAREVIVEHMPELDQEVPFERIAALNERLGELFALEGHTYGYVVDALHTMGRMNTSEIADWLESEGL